MASAADKTGETPAPPGHLRKKVLDGGIYLFLRQFLSLGLSLIGVFVITRLIGPAHYGAYVAALGIYWYLGELGHVGMEVYLVRQPGHLAEYEYHVASTLLLTAGLVLVGLVEASSGLLSGWLQVEGFEQLLRVLIIALPFQLIATAPTAKLERLLDYRRVAAIELSGQVCYYIVAVPLAVAGCGAWSLVVGWMVQQIGTSVLFHRAARYLPRLCLDRTVVPRMLSYTLGFSMVTWTWQLRALVNPLVVGHFLGAEAVGQIGMAVRIVEALTFVKAIAWRLSAATLSRIQHDRQKLREAVTLGMELQTLALAPMLLGFAWLGGLFLPQLFGERWSPALDVFPFIAVSYLTNAQFNMHSSVLAVFQKNYENATFCGIHVILFAAGAVICVPLTGLVGYGWGEMLALASYYVLHRFAIVVVGSIRYRIAAVWWVGAVLGLFWREIGLWAMAMPFIALMWPESIRHLRTLYYSVRPTSWRATAT
jgi:O-antigen/teichoic acid export membrane protein